MFNAEQDVSNPKEENTLVKKWQDVDDDDGIRTF